MTMSQQIYGRPTCRRHDSAGQRGPSRSPVARAHVQPSRTPPERITSSRMRRRKLKLAARELAKLVRIRAAIVFHSPDPSLFVRSGIRHESRAHHLAEKMVGLRQMQFPQG